MEAHYSKLAVVNVPYIFEFGVIFACVGETSYVIVKWLFPFFVFDVIPVDDLADPVATVVQRRLATDHAAYSLAH